MAFEFLYDLPNSVLLVLFIIFVVVLALIGLYLFIFLIPTNLRAKFHNRTTGIFLSATATIMAIAIAFIISDEWEAYSKAVVNMDEEATSLSLLYGIVSSLPNTILTQQLIIQYLCYIINVEFPALSQGNIPDQGIVIIDQLRDAIFNYSPMNDKELALYQRSLDLFNDAIALRTVRISDSLTGISDELWWVMIIGVTIVIVISWFIIADIVYHSLLVALLSIGLASLLFLAVALNYPFRGDFGLDPTPFELALTQIQGNTNCATVQ